MEDDRTTALESQLGQAKQIAEEADKKYEEVSKKAGTNIRPFLQRDNSGRQGPLIDIDFGYTHLEIAVNLKI